MKKLGVLILCVLLFTACHSDDALLKAPDYLIFGHFYGMCVGESCVETFKLTEDKLFEDANDGYSGTKFDFYELDATLFEQVKDLKDAFPERLLTETTDVFGCPDCADGGGLLIQLSKNGKLYTWKIDQSKNNVPEYLHDFMEKVNAKISLINN